LETWNLKCIFGDKFCLDFTTFFISKFFEKNYFTKIWNSTNFDSSLWKWGLKFYFAYNSHILTMSCHALSLTLSHTFEDSWQIMDFIIKTTSPPFILTKFQWSKFFTLPSKTFLMVDGHWTLFWSLLLTLDIFIFYNILVN